MKMTVTTQINPIQQVSMEVDGRLEECMRGLNAMLSFNGACGCCKSGRVTLEFKEAKGFQFYEFHCHECQARAQWGQYKSGGFFLKKWEKFDPNGPNQVPGQYPDQQPQSSYDDGPPPTDRDIPKY